MFNVTRLASAIQNQVLSGLSGYNSTLSIPMAQLEDEVVQEYLVLLKKYSLKNMLPKKDLLVELNCIEIDCKSLSNCCESLDFLNDATAHFEIPPIVNDFGDSSIEYIGSINKQKRFTVYTNLNFKHHKFKLRGNTKPYVFVNTSVNQNGLLDCYLFNAPFLERVSIIAVFKDPRQVEAYMRDNGCCEWSNPDTQTWLDQEIIQSLTNKYLKYFRQMQATNTSTDSIPR